MPDTPSPAAAAGTRKARPRIAHIRHKLVAVYVLMLVVLAASVLTIVLDVRSNDRAQAVRDNLQLARIVEEHLARTFGEADKVLQGLAEHIAAHGGTENLDEQTLHERLASRQAALPQAAAFSIVRADGRLFARATEYPVMPVDMSNSADFVHLRTATADTTFVGNRILPSQAKAEWIHLARRITLPGGRFGGIVRCRIDTEHLIRFYDDLAMAPETVLALVKPDGKPIFRRPGADDLSRLDVSNTPAFANGRPAGHEGHFTRNSPLDGRTHLVAWHWLPGASLGVFIGLPLERAQAGSDRLAQRLAAGALIAALAFGALFRIILRHLAREEKLSLRRQAAERAQRQSDEQYRALAENIPQRVFYKDRECRFIATNRPFAEDLGLPLEDIVGRDDFDLHPRELAEKYRQSDLHVMASGQAESFDEQFVRNGKALTIHTVKTPVRDESGEIVGVCGIYWDVTEQLALQNRLKESEARLRTIFDSVQEGFLAAESADGKLFLANRAICRMTGYSEAELQALSPLELHPPEAGVRVAAAFANMAHSEYDLVRDMPVQRKDGSIFFAEISSNSFTIDGRTYHIGVFRDVTELRQAREALSLGEANLREAQRIAHVGSWGRGLTDDTAYWTEEFFRIMEMAPQPSAPPYRDFLAAVHPDDRDRVDTAFRALVKEHDAYDFVHRLLFADGRIKYVRQRGEVRTEGEDARQRFLGTIQDITEQMLAEQAIRALNESLERRVAERTEELARANRELESFSYSVSHDLRAPLRAINGFSRILQDSEEFALSGESRELLERIVRNTNRMGELIDDILDYSRASQAALNRREADMTQLARSACDEHAPSYPNATTRIGPLGSVRGDPAMLRQVFDNLVGNALKYSARKDRPEIEIGRQNDGDDAVFFVRDNGAGFDMQYAGKLFGMFQRMHTDKDFPGTGVGLAIVKRIVERHGGRVWAEAAPEAGATFYFTLPHGA